MSTAEGATDVSRQSSFVPLGIVPDVPMKGWTKAVEFNDKWTGFEKQWMDCNLARYRQLKSKKRHDLVGWVIRQIHNLWGETYGDTALKNPKTQKEWKRRKKSIEDYFRNHGRQDAEVKVAYHTGKVSFGSVLRRTKAAKIEELAGKLSGGLRKGDKGWLGYYKKAEAEIRAGLSSDDRKEIEDLMQEYEAKGIPAEDQAKKAEAAGGKTLSWFHKYVFEKFGMRCITLVSWYDVNAQLQYAIHDINDEMIRRGMPAVKTLRATNAKGFEIIDQAFREYCQAVKAAERRDMTEAVGRRSAAASVRAEVKCMDGGHVLVPDQVEKETQTYQANVIRQVMNKEYSLAKQLSDRSVPWREVCRQPSVFIHPKYLPNDVQLRDPEKLKKEETRSILAHWRDRQAQGKVPLKFKRVLANGKVETPSYPDDLKAPEKAGVTATTKPSPIAIVAPKVTDDLTDSSIGSVPEAPPRLAEATQHIVEGGEDSDRSHNSRALSPPPRVFKRQKGKSKKIIYTPDGSQQSGDNASAAHGSDFSEPPNLALTAVDKRMISIKPQLPTPTPSSPPTQRSTPTRQDENPQQLLTPTAAGGSGTGEERSANHSPGADALPGVPSAYCNPAADALRPGKPKVKTPTPYSPLTQRSTPTKQDENSQRQFTPTAAGGSGTGEVQSANHTPGADALPRVPSAYSNPAADALPSGKTKVKTQKTAQSTKKPTQKDRTVEVNTQNEAELTHTSAQAQPPKPRPKPRQRLPGSAAEVPPEVRGAKRLRMISAKAKLLPEALGSTSRLNKLQMSKGTT